MVSCAVIGAGPAGLITLRELRAEGIDAVCFEANDRIGGVFSKGYKGCQLTSSSNITHFGIFPHNEEDRPRFWSVSEYAGYLNRFVDHFGLRSFISLNTKVERIDAQGSGWNLTLSQFSHDVFSPTASEKSSSSTPVADGDQKRTLYFDKIVVCSGLHSNGGRIPDWQGRDVFQGEIIHSSEFQDASAQCAGKRVLVVGVGESGSDIALLAAAQAKSTCVAIRTIPGFVVPRIVGGRPSDIDTNRTHYAVPRDMVTSWYWQTFKKVKLWLESLYLTKDDDREVLGMASKLNKSAHTADGTMLTNFNRFGTKNTSFLEAARYHGAELKGNVARLDERGAIFEDGSRFDCDLIICCTGFHKRFPFLEGTSLSVVNDDLLGPRGIRSLYKRVFHPDFSDKIAFVGFLRPGFGAIPPIAEMQARFVAGVLARRIALPSSSDMKVIAKIDADRDLKQYPHDGERLTELGDYMVHMEDYATIIGCRPPLVRLFLFYPRLWYKIMNSSISATQFRLVGPGSNFELASRSIVRMPTMPLPIVILQTITLAFFKLASILGAKGFKPVGL